ncbi:TPA: minor capsid protein [Streptococcus suis]|uniref:Minor capsid protein n=3 Tax=Streptococcus suis TaxID=1307 RepID=A0A116SA61_STRSU|nr:minor capsid protein [Streptococcus suis]AIG43853.1 head morphogenesis protein [Streptococcus suis 6407]AML47513.1 phage head morphogenesis protein [Streptococcus suis]KPA57114.1 head morphogenesis protein [Streptococcus suis]KPA60517.1 head morphogenesis protein [Streptococcus suis]MBL1132377.1 phage head morphogenesis protein [Streptococcus suis]
MVQEMDKAEQTAKQLDEIHKLASRHITSKIDQIFESYRRDHGLTEDEARRVLDNVKNLSDIRELKLALQNTTDSEEIRQLLILLDLAPYASRIERYEALQREVDNLPTRLYKAENEASRAFYDEFIPDAYYHSVFDLQQQSGVAFAFNRIDPEEIRAIQQTPWLGANYSERIWGNTQALASELQKQLAVSLLTGRSAHETAEVIEAQFGKGSQNARRLIRTETSYFHAEMEAKAYEEADVEYYRFLATLDLRTSSICREHDGKIYKVSERITGKNYPPMHPWCRSDTIASDDSEWLAKATRSARDPVTGKTIQVPANMTYKDWYEKYVKPKYKADNLDIWKIERANNQYEKYKSILGDKAPKSLEDYIDLKYNDKEGYGQLQDQARWIKAKFPSEKSFNGHFEKHGHEFPSLTKEEYRKLASELIASPTDENILGYETEGGRRVRYDKAENIIVIGRRNKNNQARLNTMLKPDEGEKYYYENYKRDFPD